MRTIVILLLLANLTLFGYTRLDSVGAGEGMRLKEQIQPDKIKILTSQEVATLGPAKVAALSDVCVEWGPLSAADVTRATVELEPLQLGRLLSQRRVELDGASWVTVGPFPNRASADRRVTELRTQNVGDISVVDAGRGQFVVSFGVFRTPDAANARLEQVQKLGVTAAKSQPRQSAVAQTMLVVRDPQQPAVVRIKELQTQYPGSDVKVGACPTA